MFAEKTFEERLASWAIFRNELETASKPFTLLTETYNLLQRHSCSYNPWNQTEWPTPWELIDRNKYCSFSIALGMSYSLLLTDRFRKDDLQILITKNNQDCITKYLIKAGLHILGYTDDLSSVLQSQMLTTDIIQKNFTLEIKR